MNRALDLMLKVCHSTSLEAHLELTTDGFKAYLSAVNKMSMDRCDFAQPRTGLRSPADLGRIRVGICVMPELDIEIAAYETMRADLESRHIGKWVLLHDREIVGLYDSLGGAAEEAVRRFGRGPYLIRQVGAPPVVLPASIMYSPVHG